MREKGESMDSSEIIHEFGLQSDLFWDPLGEAEIKAAASEAMRPVTGQL